MYETPYDRFGMLNYQIWRAARLVVDTGIHSQGWSRDRAVTYFREYTALPEHEIQTEIDACGVTSLFVSPAYDCVTSNCISSAKHVSFIPDKHEPLIILSSKITVPSCHCHPRRCLVVLSAVDRSTVCHQITAPYSSRLILASLSCV